MHTYEFWFALKNCQVLYLIRILNVVKYDTTVMNSDKIH